MDRQAGALFLFSPKPRDSRSLVVTSKSRGLSGIMAAVRVHHLVRAYRVKIGTTPAQCGARMHDNGTALR